jgi:metal-sulfur cluster biosynthetic enzyme
MFIQTEATADPARLIFLPGREVLAGGALDLNDQVEAAISPLAEKLFEIPYVSRVSLGKDSILVTKTGGDWQLLKPAIFGAIMEHFLSGAPILYEKAMVAGRLPEASPGGEKAEVAEQVREALRQVIDPELGYNIVDLGLVYDVVVEDDGVVHIEMTTTTPGCPATNYLKQGAGEAAGTVPGVDFIEVKLTYEPRWTPERMSPEAKAHFGIRD